MKILIVIPARFSSTRLPGKPLKKIYGKELILRVIEACAPLVRKNIRIIVATDNKKIFDLVNFFKSEALNRILDCVDHLSLNDATHKFLNKKCPYEYNKYAYDISKVNELKDIFDELNSQKFIEFLENLTGIENLLANMKGGV